MLLTDFLLPTPSFLYFLDPTLDSRISFKSFRFLGVSAVSEFDVCVCSSVECDDSVWVPTVAYSLLFDNIITLPLHLPLIRADVDCTSEQDEPSRGWLKFNRIDGRAFSLSCLITLIEESSKCAEQTKWLFLFVSSFSNKSSLSINVNHFRHLKYKIKTYGRKTFKYLSSVLWLLCLKT